MKKTTILLGLFVISFTYAAAQITEESRAMTQGINNSLTISIPDADDKMVERLWKKFMKSHGSKTKKIKRSEEWLSSKADITSIGGSSDINVYATFEQSGSDVRMTAWFELKDTYLSSMEHPERYAAGEAFLNDFEMAVYKEGVKREVKEEENNLRKLESELKKLRKNNDRYHKEIKAAKEKIAKMEANIEENVVEQEDMGIKISAQKEVVELTKRKMDHRDN